MKVQVVDRVASTLPDDDDHPYRTGAWKPNLVEYDATDLDVIAGAIPEDLNGVYLRNTRTPSTTPSGCTTPSTATGCCT